MDIHICMPQPYLRTHSPHMWKRTNAPELTQARQSNDSIVLRLLAELMGLTGSGAETKRLEIGALRGSLEELLYGDFGLGEMNFTEVVGHFGQQ
ncbi:uncharacterized [Tachysurus ichikawai]